MNFDNILILPDNRVKGLSISLTTTAGEYIAWFNEFGQKNKLEEQRPVLTSRSANMIRKRLIDDLTMGAVIPPIVLGLSVEGNLGEVTVENVGEFISQHLEEATVIDGMQRSNALSQALLLKEEISSNRLRIDFWLANDAISLIYRMLVLNTGQTPWDVKGKWKLSINL